MPCSLSNKPYILSYVFLYLMLTFLFSFSWEMSDFYEQSLVAAGVVIEKGVTAERLWGLEEQVRAFLALSHRMGTKHVELD